MCRYCVTEASDTIRISVAPPEARASGSEAEDVPGNDLNVRLFYPLPRAHFFLC